MKNQSSIIKYKPIDLILVYLLIGFSVIPFFSGNTDLMAIITFFALLYLVATKRNVMGKGLFALFVVLTIMYVGQFITLNLESFPLRSVLGTFIRFLFPFLVIKIIGKDFPKVFVRVVFVLTIISFGFWIAENLSSNATQTIRQISKDFNLDTESNENILIYNLEGSLRYGIIRNSGFAYEGGAFSIILVIALLFNLLINKYKIDLSGKVFIFAIITAFSTAGYIVLFILLYSYWFTKIRGKIQLFTFSILFFSLIFYAFISLDFLEDKILAQLEVAKNPYSTAGRFASASADLLEWQRNPIWGVGKFEESRFKVFSGMKEQHRVNGLADFLAKFGIIVFATYLFLLYASLKKLNTSLLGNSKSFIFHFIAFVGLAFAQTCMQWSVFIALLFLDELNSPNKNIDEKSNHNLS